MDYQRKPIPGFPGYEADTDGNVWSCWKLKKLSGSWGGTKSYISDEYIKLKTWPDKGGYQRVCLRNGGKKTFRFVAPIILETFVSKRPLSMESCHNNGVRTDNRLENLRWDTKKNNQADRIQHGTELTGENNPYAKLTNKQVRVIKWALLYGAEGSFLANVFKVSASVISSINTSKTWKNVIIS